MIDDSHSWYWQRSREMGSLSHGGNICNHTGYCYQNMKLDLCRGWATCIMLPISTRQHMLAWSRFLDISCQCRFNTAPDSFDVCVCAPGRIVPVWAAGHVPPVSGIGVVLACVRTEGFSLAVSLPGGNNRTLFASSLGHVIVRHTTSHWPQFRITIKTAKDPLLSGLPRVPCD